MYTTVAVICRDTAGLVAATLVLITGARYVAHLHNTRDFAPVFST